MQQLAGARGLDRGHRLRNVQSVHEPLDLARSGQAQDDVLHADAVDVEQEGGHGRSAIRRLAGKEQIAHSVVKQRLAYQAGMDRRNRDLPHLRRQRHLGSGRCALAPLGQQLLPAYRLGGALLCVSFRHGLVSVSAPWNVMTRLPIVLAMDFVKKTAWIGRVILSEPVSDPKVAIAAKESPTKMGVRT
ncbi:MAG: hypothetical protein AB7U95_22040 [Reyranella sp.]